MRWFVAPFAIAREAVLGCFAPAADASPSSVRKHGAIAVLIGLGLFMLGGGLMLVVHRLSAPDAVEKLLIVPLAFAYAFLIVGGYRVLTGAEPDTNRDSLGASLRRIAIGVAAVVVSVALLFALFMLVGLALGLK